MRMCSENVYFQSGIQKELAKMTTNCESLKNHQKETQATALPHSDVDERVRARVSDTLPNFDEVPAKKRRTRRRKNKRRHPYNNRKTEQLVKPEAPHNSNQFLIEDQVNIKELDGIFKDRLPTRTRDSSFSLDDSEGEFYSSPDDEEAFLMKEFDDQYETVHTERLNTMTNNELIQECIQLEKKVDYLTKRLKGKNSDYDESSGESREEMDKLVLENEALRRENIDLRNRLNATLGSASSTAASGTSDSCSSCSSSSSDSEVDQDKINSSVVEEKLDSTSIDYTHTNGHSPTTVQPV